MSTQVITDNFPLTQEELDLLNSVVEETHQEIPVNSNALLVSETTSRFSSAIWFEKIQSKSIILAGLGGIGSWIALLLARMSPACLCLYDDDIVEEANMSGQLYGLNNISMKKTTALCSILSNFANYNTSFCFDEKYTEESATRDIMICGFDNMEARKTFFNKWLNHVSQLADEDKANCLYIDGRLAAEEFQILCIKGDDIYNIKRYKNDYLFTEKEAEETLCSYKQTIFCANMIASYIVNLFVNFCANQCNPIVDRYLPFFTSYNAELMFFKTEL